MRKYKQVFAAVTLTIILSGCSGNEEAIVEKHSNDVVANETDYIVTIENHGFLKEDMEFYTLMQKVKNEVDRVNDAEDLTGKELDESNNFWEAQNKQYDNINAQLQNMIEIHAMSLLAKEKNYYIPMEKLDAEVERLNAVIDTVPTLQKMIQRYGEKNYKVNIRGYMEERMLRDRIAADIKKTVREENPQADEQEIRFLIKDHYDDLYQDQVSQLELVINLK